ncbi:MAG: alpha-ketoacid dehydrogenase subunit beta [Armatimonadota bacterium]
MTRVLTYAQAVREAIDQTMAADPRVYLMGLGVPDPKGIFGTTSGLIEKYGPDRVLDMPVAENGMTGIAIGSALVGLRPIMTHQRVDFVLLAMEQIVNQAANWHYMFGGQQPMPLVIRLIIGRGWGQGPQHSQSLQAWFAHVPGLKVLMPTTPHDAKGLLVAAVEDDNPVIILEHRWLHNITGHVPEEVYRVPLGSAHCMREGADVTIAATSLMSLEALRAAEFLAEEGIDCEVIDLRSVRPLDKSLILESVRKTGRLIVADTGWKTLGLGSELLALAAEEAFDSLRRPPKRIALPDCPTPTSPALAESYYPRTRHIVDAAREMLQRASTRAFVEPDIPHDIPDPSFTGPF